jgi:hypothetical protein
MSRIFELLKYDVLQKLYEQFKFKTSTNIMSRGSCRFSEKFVEEYNFIEPVPDDDTKAKCTRCNVLFSIKNKGKHDIEQHVSSTKHIQASKLKISEKVTNFFHKKKADNEDLRIAQIEITWCYHNVRHNHSFRSMDCTSQLLKKFISPKFSCARTKTACGIQHVIAKFIDAQMIREISSVNFVVIACDASNHGSTKLLPVLLR